MKQAALLQQQARGQGLVYHLRAGATGSGAVLAEWPATIGALAAIAAAEAYGREHGLVVVVRRAWLDERLGRWVVGARVETPDGVGEVLDYDAENDQHLVRLDGETEARSYAPERLRRAQEG
jgi:hypothetical protein